MARVCAHADIVITTAQLFGKPASRIITAEMVAGMRPNSVIVDLAAATGGNVAGSRPDEEVTLHGVRIIGLTNLPGKVARDASLVYASNLTNLFTHVWDKEQASVTFNLADEIVDNALLTHEGEIRMDTVDVAVVIGANDVVNPSARDDPGSPLYGMPIINVDQAQTVFVLKRSLAAGFSGVQNPLFFKDNTRMLFGDAKASLSALVSEFKEALAA